MAELQIGRLEARYHLPPSRRGEKERLDRLLATAAGEALESGLERLGLSGEGELCIREVKVPLRLRLARSDDALVLAWGDAMAAAVLAALREGDGETVLRFASRRAALADFALGVARGDWRHGWAWRQLGFSQEGEAGGELARALAAEPEALVPILAAVAEAGWLPGLARRFEASWWPQLAALALTSVGWSSVSFSSFGEVGGPLGGGTDDTDEPGRTRTVTDYDTDSAVAGLGAAGWRRLGFSSAGLPELRRSRLAALFEVLRVAPGSPLGQALAALVWLEVDPGRLRAASAASRSELLAATAAVLAPEPVAELRPAAVRPAVAEALSGDTISSRRLGLTEWGGLLFLVGVADDLGFPEEVAGHPVLGLRPGRWVWHQLALTLAPVGPENPAALAFAGLLPGNKSPAFEAAPAGEEEQAALAGLAERLLQETAARLETRAQHAAPLHRHSPPARRAAPAARTGNNPAATTNPGRGALLDLVCRRRARVLADPGWIEIHFSLGDVDTELRRARLDLDPGFVPWLGVVLRFVYE